MYCKHCGKEIKEGVEFCKYCGGAVINEQIPQREYAAFLIRFGAFIIDYALILLSAFILGFVFSSFFLSLSFLGNEVLGFSILIIYHVLFLSIFSSTPGKMLYRLMVIDEKTELKVSFGKALLRSVSYILSFLFFGLGFLFIGFDKEKHRGWHDRIAKTLVIRKKKKSLFLPIILSIIALCFSVYAIYFLPEDYDFSYLGEEATVLDSIQKRLSQQPSGVCCSYVPPYEIDYFIEDIPLISSLAEEKNAEQIFEDFGEAIIVVGGETEYEEFYFGSGFLISPSGLIVTNYHVIEDMDRLAVALGENKVFDVDTIVAEDPNKDIAVLKIEGQNLPYIVMGDSNLVKVGQKIFAIGNPEGYTNTISEGIVSQIREFEAGINSFQITAPISQGSSGGALLNTKGEVIGITNMIDWYGQNINFAIPINYVKELIGLNPNLSEFMFEDLDYSAFDVEPEEPSGLILCNDVYWQPCPAGQKFYCPKEEDAQCYESDAILCNDKYWSPCPVGQKFYCPPTGDPSCYYE